MFAQCFSLALVGLTTLTYSQDTWWSFISISILLTNVLAYAGQITETRPIMAIILTTWANSLLVVSALLVGAINGPTYFLSFIELLLCVLLSTVADLRFAFELLCRPHQAPLRSPISNRLLYVTGRYWGHLGKFLPVDSPMGLRIDADHTHHWIDRTTTLHKLLGLKNGPIFDDLLRRQAMLAQTRFRADQEADRWETILHTTEAEAGTSLYRTFFRKFARKSLFWRVIIAGASSLTGLSLILTLIFTPFTGLLLLPIGGFIVRALWRAVIPERQKSDLEWVDILLEATAHVGLAVRIRHDKVALGLQLGVLAARFNLPSSFLEQVSALVAEPQFTSFESPVKAGTQSTEAQNLNLKLAGTVAVLVATFVAAVLGVRYSRSDAGKRLRDFVSTLKSGQDFVTNFVPLVQESVNEVWYSLGGTEAVFKGQYHALASDANRLTKQMETHVNFFADPLASMTTEHARGIFAIAESINTLYTTIQHDHVPTHYVAGFLLMRANFVPLIQRARAHLASGIDRIPPDVVLVTGGPGTGKTEFLRSMVKSFGIAKNKTDYKPEEIYIWEDGSNFQEAMSNSKKVVFIREFLTNLKSESRSKEISFLMSQADPVAQMAIMPGLDGNGKGSVFFNNELTVLASNFGIESWQKELSSFVADPQAVFRRCGIVLRLTRSRVGLIETDTTYADLEICTSRKLSGEMAWKPITPARVVALMLDQYKAHAAQRDALVPTFAPQYTSDSEDEPSLAQPPQLELVINTEEAVQGSPVIDTHAVASQMTASPQIGDVELTSNIPVVYRRPNAYERLVAESGYPGLRTPTPEETIQNLQFSLGLATKQTESQAATPELKEVDWAFMKHGQRVTMLIGSEGLKNLTEEVIPAIVYTLTEKDQTFVLLYRDCLLSAMKAEQLKCRMSGATKIVMICVAGFAVAGVASSAWSYFASNWRSKFYAESQAGYAGDLQPRPMPPPNVAPARLVTRKVVAEGRFSVHQQMDQNADAVATSLAKSSVLGLTVKDISAYLLMIHGHQGVTVRHLFPDPEKRPSLLVTWPGDLPKVVTFSPSEYHLYAWDFEIEGVTEPVMLDMLGICFHSPKMPLFPDISHHIAFAKDLEPLSRGQLLLTEPPESRYNLTNPVVDHLSHWNYRNSNAPVSRNVVTASGETKHGMCGCPVFAVNTAMPRKLIGIHQSAWRGKTQACLFPDDLLETLSEHYEKNAPKPILAQPTTAQCLKVGNQPFKKPRFWRYLGEAPSYAKRSLQLQSLLTATPLLEHNCPEHALFFCVLKKCPNAPAMKKLPVRMTPYMSEERIYPVQEALAKFDLPYEGIEWFPRTDGTFTDLILLTRQHRDGLVRETLPPPLRGYPFILSEQQALNGIVGSPFFRGLDLRRSAGPTELDKLRVEKHWVGTGKFAYVRCSVHDTCNLQCGNPRIYRQEVSEALAPLRDLLALGEFQAEFALAMKPDETRPFTDGPPRRMKPPRPLMGPTIENLQLTKEVFTSTQAAVQANVYESPILLGLDPFSLETSHRLAERAQLVALAGDIPTWDSRLRDLFFALGVDFLASWLEVWGFRDRNAIAWAVRARAIAHSYMEYLLYVEGFAFAVSNQGPTGNPITALLNSLFNAIRCFMTWAMFRIRRGLPVIYEVYQREVKKDFLGDDFALYIPESSGWTNQEHASDSEKYLHFPVTSPDKVAEMPPFYRFEQVQIVQRKPRVKLGRFILALEPDSIERQFNFETVRDDSIFFETVKEGLWEYFVQLPAADWDEKRRKLQEYFDTLPEVRTLPSLADCTERFVSYRKIRVPPEFTDEYCVEAQSSSAMEVTEVPIVSEQAGLTQVERASEVQTNPRVTDTLPLFQSKVGVEITRLPPTVIERTHAQRITWTVGAAADTTFATVKFPGDILTNLNAIESFVGHYDYMRCAGTLKVQISSSIVANGLFGITVVPFVNDSVGYPNYVTRNQWLSNYTVMVHPSTKEVVNVDLPWSQPFPWMRVTDIVGGVRWACRVRVWIIDALTWSSASPPSAITVSLFWNLTDVELTGPRPTTSIPLEIRLMKLKKEAANEQRRRITESQGKTKKEAPASEESIAKSTTTMVPHPGPPNFITSLLGAPLSFIGDVVGGIFPSVAPLINEIVPFAKLLTPLLMDKPDTVATPLPVFNASLSTLSLMEGISLNQSLGERQGHSIPPPPNASNPDILELLSIPYHLSTTLVTSASPQYFTVLSGYWNPMDIRELTNVTTVWTWTPSNLAKFTACYRYWSGSARLAFHICASALTRGVFTFIAVPPHCALPADDSTSNDVYKRVIEYTGETWAFVTLPFWSTELFVAPYSLYGTVDGGDPLTAPGNQAGCRYILSVSVSPIVPDSSASSSVYVHTWISAGPDFRLYDYQGPGYGFPKLELPAALKKKQIKALGSPPPRPSEAQSSAYARWGSAKFDSISPSQMVWDTGEFGTSLRETNLKKIGARFTQMDGEWASTVRLCHPCAMSMTLGFLGNSFLGWSGSTNYYQVQNLEQNRSLTTRTPFLDSTQFRDSETNAGFQLLQLERHPMNIPYSVSQLFSPMSLTDYSWASIPGGHTTLFNTTSRAINQDYMAWGDDFAFVYPVTPAQWVFDTALSSSKFSSERSGTKKESMVSAARLRGREAASVPVLTEVTYVTEDVPVM